MCHEMIMLATTFCQLSKFMVYKRPLFGGRDGPFCTLSKCDGMNMDDLRIRWSRNPTQHRLS